MPGYHGTVFTGTTGARLNLAPLSLRVRVSPSLSPNLSLFSESLSEYDSSFKFSPSLSESLSMLPTNTALESERAFKLDKQLGRRLALLCQWDMMPGRDSSFKFLLGIQVVMPIGDPGISSLDDWRKSFRSPQGNDDHSKSRRHWHPPRKNGNLNTGTATH